MHPEQDPSLAGEGLALPHTGADADALHELPSSAADSAQSPGDETLARSWDELLEELRKLLNRQQMETWFRTALLRSAGPEGVVLVVQNSFTSNWLRSAPYITALETAVRNVFGASWPVQIVVDPELVVRARSGLPAGAPTGSASPAPLRPTAPATPSVPAAPRTAREGRAPSEAGLLWSSDVALNPHYRFDNFVVGPCNRFAYAAAVGVSESPGRSYNPFFLHGSVGLGQTHLLQSLCYSLLERDPETRILYLSCETFINHFISALENGDLQKFRNKYRNVDVLVVDDIHLLANKERTQEEFFHTFNTLYNASKQIVLSSDSPPKEIPTLQDRLVSRFKWGLVTEIEKPCYETRMAILKRKSRERGKELPDSVAQLVAEHVDSNIRELEGAVNRLLGYASLNSLDVTPDLARHVLRDVFLSPKGQPSMDDILRLVTSHFQIKVTELQSRRRTKAIAHPRQIAMFLARSITRHSLEEIGGFFGGRDHTTVLYAVEQIEKQMKADDRFRAMIQGLLGQLQR